MMREQYERLAEWLKRSTFSEALASLGVRSVLGEALRWCLFTEERHRSRAIRRDYLTCRATIEAMSNELPSGDPSKPVWMIGSMHTVWGVKLEGIISVAVRLAGMMPVAVNTSRFRWVERYHRSFAIHRSINVESFHGVVAQSSSQGAWDILPEVASLPELMELTYHGVDVGRIAVSNHVYKNKFAQFDFSNVATRAAIWREILAIQKNVHAAEAMRKAFPPVMGMLLEKGISPFAEIFGACVAAEIPVVQYVGSQNTNQYVLKRYTARNRHQHPFSLDPSTWEATKKMSWSSGRSESLMTEFSESYEKGTWFNRRYLHQDKKIKSRDEVIQQLSLDPNKKTAVVFSHVLWDATFFYGTSLFQDYETWLIETVQAACKNSNLNWLIKLHPDLVWKLKYEKHTGELRDSIAIRSAVGKLPDHVKVIAPDTDLSTLSFFQITDVCVTVRGTIGIEMACHGIPVLTAGTGRYAGLGFTVDSSTKDDYLRRLAEAHTIPRLADAQIELARRFGYVLFMRRPWPVQSFQLVKKPMSSVGDPLDTNIVFQPESGLKLAHAPDLEQLALWLQSEEADFLRSDESPRQESVF